MLKPLRPWGPLHWLLPRIKHENWAVLGTVSVEDRCLATLQELGRTSAAARLLAIRDPDPLDKNAFESRIEARKREFTLAGASVEAFADVPLLADLDTVRAQATGLLDQGAENIVLDISAMPKRWFFALLKFLLLDNRAQTVVVTYASPAEYGRQLSENPGPILMLPGFGGEGAQDYNSVVVGIGFEPLGVTNLIKDLRLNRIRLLFPFPPGPPGYDRNWMFVKSIEEMTRTQNIEPPDRQAVHMFDSPHVFDALCEMTDFGAMSTVLAPYGPKPMSLAMCLFSLAAAHAGRAMVPVYYAQPRRYSLEYSTGTRTTASGKADIKGYCVKLRGQLLYTI